MPSPSIDTMWQEIRVLKNRVCNLEKVASNQSEVLQFVVGEPSSSAVFSRGDINMVTLPVNSTYILEIRDKNIQRDSVDVFWDNLRMPIKRLDRESYSITYMTDRVIITRPAGNPFLDGQLYLITYRHA